VGDHVYLIAEDAAAPLYLTRIVGAFEDLRAEGSERLCIEARARARAGGGRGAATSARVGGWGAIAGPGGSGVCRWGAGPAALFALVRSGSHSPFEAPALPPPKPRSAPLPHSQVQWYERRANMPPALQRGMHEREVVEWLLTDTNLVGCLERRALVVRARSYEEVGTAAGRAAGGLWRPRLACGCGLCARKRGCGQFLIAD
jgi:hypothetical protein